MQYSSGKESQRDFQSRESRLIVACLTTASGRLPKCSLHMFAFQLVPCTSFKLIVQTFLATNPSQRVPQWTLAIWHASGSQSQGTSYLRSAVVPNCLVAQWVWRAWVGVDCSTSLSCSHLDLQGSWGVLLMTTCQSGVCLQRHLKVLFAGLLK